MIREEYVDFDTARLLKAAGFPQDDDYKAYDSDGFLYSDLWELESECYAAPTQAQAMRWLRVERGIVVEPRPGWPYDDEAECIKMKWDALVIESLTCPTEDEEFNSIAILTYFPTYEAAAEAGIKAACKYLIEKGGEA